MNNEQYIKELKDIINALADIRNFSAQSNYNINKELAETEALINHNNKRIDVYKKQKEKLKASPSPKINDYRKITDTAIDILSHHIIIHDKKNDLSGMYLSEIFKKIELLGSKVSDLSSLMIKTLADEEEV